VNGCKYRFTVTIVRVVNIAVLVSLPILSTILLKYWHDYRRYFSSVVLKWVSAILFGYFWQYSVAILLSASNAAAAAAQWRLRQNIAGGCPHACSYTLMHRAGRHKLHTMDTRARVCVLRGWKNRCQDSHNRLKNVCIKTRPGATDQLTLCILALRVI